MSKTVAVYVRVSTTEQSTALQRQDLLRMCEAKGWRPVVYEDNGISGSTESRPQLDALMQACRQGHHSIVLVWRFDRFARSTSHLLRALEEFRTLNIDFISYTEGIDSSSHIGKVCFTLVAAIAEFERSLIQERVRAGVARAQAEGIHCGRPRSGFDVAKAVRLKSEGWGVRKIAREVGVSHATVHRTLQALEAA